MRRSFAGWSWRAALLAAGLALPGVGGIEAQIPAATGELVYAVYDGVETAGGTLGTLGPSLATDRTGAYAVVSRDLSGQIAVQEQPRGTLGRRVFLSGLAALLGPGAEGDAAASGIDTLRAALVPGSSGILALVDPGSAQSLMALLQPTSPRLLGTTGVGVTPQETAAEDGGVRASPPVQSSATGYPPGTDYEPGVGIQPGTGYTAGVGAIQPDTADLPDDRR